MFESINEIKIASLLAVLMLMKNRVIMKIRVNGESLRNRFPIIPSSRTETDILSFEYSGSSEFLETLKINVVYLSMNSF